MADVNILNSDVSIMAEAALTEGTHVPPAAAGDFVAVLKDSINDLIVPAKEVLERCATNASLDELEGRSGIKSVSGTIGVEFKAGVSGAAPDYAPAIHSALGTTSVAVASATSGTGHTAGSIKMASTAAYSVGDIILIKQSAAYHVSPIESIVTNTSLELLVDCAAAPSDNVAIVKLLDYRTANSGHPSFSVTKFNEDAVKETAAGCKTSMSIENWVTGQYPTLSFGYQGMSFTRTVTANSYTPSLDTSLPVVALGACVYKDGVSTPMDGFTFSLENTLEPKTSTCNSNGIIGLRVTARKGTGTINPYKSTLNVNLFDEWNDDDTFSLFAYTGNPTGTDGEIKEIVSIYLPNCQFSEIAQTDKGGLAQDSMTFAVKKHATLPSVIIAMGE